MRPSGAPRASPNRCSEGRRERQPHGVEVSLRDHGEPKRVRHALAIGLAVGGEPVHRLDQRLELQRRTDLADEVRGLVACVPEPVRRLRRHRQPGAGACDELLAADLEADGAAEDLEPLLLQRVHVRGRDEASRLHVRLDHDRLAARLPGGLAEHEALAGDRVLDAVACADHVWLLPSFPPLIGGRENDRMERLKDAWRVLKGPLRERDPDCGVPHQRTRGGVLRGHERVQPFDARGARVGSEAIHQDRPDPAALPFVRDFDRHFGHGAVAHEACDADRLALDEGDEHVVVAVDARQQLEIPSP